MSAPWRRRRWTGSEQRSPAGCRTVLKKGYLLLQGEDGCFSDHQFCLAGAYLRYRRHCRSRRTSRGCVGQVELRVTAVLSSRALSSTSAAAVAAANAEQEQQQSTPPLNRKRSAVALLSVPASLVTDIIGAAAAIATSGMHIFTVVGTTADSAMQVSWTLSAESAAEREAWVAALQSACKTHTLAAAAAALLAGPSRTPTDASGAAAENAGQVAAAAAAGQAAAGALPVPPVDAGGHSGAAGAVAPLVMPSGGAAAAAAVELREEEAAAAAVVALADRMAQALEVRARAWRFRVYLGCFVGADALRWLEAEHGGDRAAATAEGARLMDCGLVYHVAYDYMQLLPEKFYRFADALMPPEASQDADPADDGALDITDPSTAALESPMLDDSGHSRAPATTDADVSAAAGGGGSDGSNAEGSRGVPCGGGGGSGRKPCGNGRPKAVVSGAGECNGCTEWAAASAAAVALGRILHTALALQLFGVALAAWGGSAASLAPAFHAAAALALAAAAASSPPPPGTQLLRLRHLLPAQRCRRCAAAAAGAATTGVPLLRAPQIAQVQHSAAAAQSAGAATTRGSSAAAAEAADALLHARRRSLSMDSALGGAPARHASMPSLSGSYGTGLGAVAAVEETVDGKGDVLRVPAVAAEEAVRLGAASLPPPDAWPQRPMLVRLSPLAKGQVRLDGCPPHAPIPFNREGASVPFETPLFKGRVVIRAAGLPGDSDPYFRGKKRLMQCAIQGEFKRAITLDRIYTGQVLSKPFTSLPPAWLVRAGLAVIRRLSPALRDNFLGETPYFVSPLASTMQCLRCDVPGEEVDISSDLAEHNALLDWSFAAAAEAGRPVSAAARKRHFASPDALRACAFAPGTVYTFDFYQHLFDPMVFELSLGVKRLRLADFLNGQPVQVMAVDTSTGEYIWNIELWHESLLAPQ